MPEADNDEPITVPATETEQVSLEGPRVDVPDEIDGVPDEKSDVPDGKADVSNEKADVSDEKTDIPDGGSDDANEKTGVPVERSDVPEENADAPHGKADDPDEKAVVRDEKPDVADETAVPKPKSQPILFHRSSSSFLRVSDLDIDGERAEPVGGGDEELQPNFHHSASDPPPGVDPDEKEKWVALGNRDGTHAPIAPLAVNRLAAVGYATVFDAEMWQADRKTGRMLKNATDSDWIHQTYTPGLVRIKEGANTYEKDVLVWTGNFKHEFYGGDLPAIRVAGIVNMSARSLLDLLVDSARVKEYNKLSLGREDAIVFQDALEQDGPFGPSVTKVTKSASKPPLIKRNMVFVTLCHAKELEDGSGYMIVNRAVHDTEEEEEAPNNVIKSEILLGVHLIRKIEGSENRCIMIHVNHMRSPMVPMMLARKLGTSAAIGFVNDIRGIC
eukprot:scaffold1442_cov128-Cylindrotheca_fusiformis.AAC.10